MCHGAAQKEFNIQQIDTNSRDIPESIADDDHSKKPKEGTEVADNGPTAKLESPSKCLNLSKYHSKYNHFHNQTEGNRAS